MALANKNKVIRDITMMVRKEFIQFEPADRIPVPSFTSRTRKGEVVNYSVGSVGYNLYYGNIQYGLFNDTTGFIVSSGEKTLDTLPQDILLKVKEQVRKYCYKAMLRAANLALLSASVDRVLGNVVNFDYSEGQPQGFIDINNIGDLEQVSFVSMFRGADNNIYISGYRYFGVDDAERFNYPLHELTDMGISDIVACLPQELKVALNNDADKEVRYMDHLLKLAESNQATVYLTFDCESERYRKVEDLMHRNNQHFIPVEFNVADMSGWNKADAVAGRIYEALDYLQDFGRLDLVFAGDSGNELDSHLVEIVDVDVFMARVLTCLNVKMDYDLRSVVCDGTDGISRSASSAAFALGIPVGGVRSSLGVTSFGMEHLEPVKKVYDHIFNSVSSKNAFKALLDSERKSSKVVQNKM